MNDKVENLRSRLENYTRFGFRDTNIIVYDINDILYILSIYKAGGTYPSVFHCIYIIILKNLKFTVYVIPTYNIT